MNSDNLINIDKSILPSNLRVAIVDGKAFPVGVNKTGNEGVIEYYRCASVDTSSGTWSGYKAILTDGVYSFEETVTEGLTYTTMVPVVDSVYSGDGGLRVGNIYVGSTEPPEDEEPEDDDVVTVFRLDDYRFDESQETLEASGRLNYTNEGTYISGEDLPKFASDEVSAFRITSDDPDSSSLSTAALNDKLPGLGDSFMITASVYIDDTNINSSGYRHILGFGKPYGSTSQADTINLLINVEKEGSTSVAVDYGADRLTYTLPGYTRSGVWITIAAIYNDGTLTLYATDGVLTENIEDFKVAERAVSILPSTTGTYAGIYLSHSCGEVLGYTGPGTGYSIATTSDADIAGRRYDFWRYYWAWWVSHVAYAVRVCGYGSCSHFVSEATDKVCQFCHDVFCDLHYGQCPDCGALYCPSCAGTYHVGYHNSILSPGITN